MAFLQERSIVSIGDIAYYVRTPAEIHLPVTENASDVTPVVIVTATQADRDTDAIVKDRLNYFSRADDVYSDLFAEHGKIVLQYPGKSSVSVSEVGEVGKKSDAQYLSLSVDEALPEGPYILRGNGLHQVWRLYPDTLEAFTLATTPSPCDTSKYEALQAGAYDGHYKVVAVPSRLYYQKTDERPLNGVRITIKDNIDLAGVKTSMGNRAFTEFYGPQKSTSSYIRELIDMGAIIVGKTKLNAFAGSEKPPDQCIDYFAPWNPRRDGYLRPAGSSSGAGVSVAGYDWVDYGVGTDTTGSVREPARACGVWGIKLTQGILPDEGLQPSCKDIDSFGLFARSSKELYDIAKISLGDRVKGGEARLCNALLQIAMADWFDDDEKLPKKLIYPLDWMSQENEAARQFSEEFFRAIEKVLGITRTEISLADEWKRSAPEAVRDIPIAEYLKNSGFYLLYYDNYHYYDEFRAEYKTKFGKEVYVSPSQDWKWNLGSKVTEEQRAQGVIELQIYRDWIHKEILTSDESGEPDSIIALPLGKPVPEYRDQTTQRRSVFKPKYLASVLGLPQIVVPVGQTPYESTISKRQEYVPGIATIAAPRGGDLMLIRTAELALNKAGWPTSVFTGRQAFAPDQNSQHDDQTTLGAKLS